jgi:spore germination protein YaaH
MSNRKQKKSLARKKSRRIKRAQIRHENRYGQQAQKKKRVAKQSMLDREEKKREEAVWKEVKEATTVKSLKELAKKYGVKGYSSWTSKNRSEAEATIVEAALAS